MKESENSIQTETKLIQQVDLDQRMGAVGSLAGGLVHEFNNVLSGIFAPVSLLEHKIAKNRPIPPEKLASSLQIIRNSAERAGKMVNQLLTISNRLESQSTEVDLNTSLQNVLALLEKTQDTSLHIEATYYQENAVTIADPKQIEQALLHVCINGAHAMTIMREEYEDWGGELQIRVEKRYLDGDFLIDFPEVEEGNYFLIEIKDSGVGIRPESIPDIFVPFFTTKEKGIGYGLGLTMVYNIIKQHKGFVGIGSELGVGTVFSLYLPVIR